MDGVTVFLVAGALAGGFVNGLAGFGTALFALGFWLQVMPPAQAVAMVLVVSVVSGLQGLWEVRSAIAAQPRRLARFLLPALPGLPIGAALLARVDADALRLVVAGFLILYGAYFLTRRSLPAFDRPTPVADVAVGFSGGVLGGLAGLSGALPAMWCGLRPWPRSETRAVLQPYNVAVLGLSAALLAWRGAYAADTLWHLAVAVPVALLAARVGIHAFRAMADATFRRLLIGLMLVSGLTLFVRVVW